VRFGAQLELRFVTPTGHKIILDVNVCNVDIQNYTFPVNKPADFSLICSLVSIQWKVCVNRYSGSARILRASVAPAKAGVPPALPE
jgi:hypothetical protein